MYDVFAVQKDIRLGDLSFAQIAQKYDMTLGEVEDVLDEMCVQEADCDDSDDGYALASAGWGTDEDYGYAGEEY